jgi:hypothetical protein
MVCDRHLQNGEFSKETSCSYLVHQCISQGFGVRLAILKRKYYKSSLLWSNIKSWSARTAQPGFGMLGGFGSESYYDHDQSLWVNILNRLWGLGFRIREGYGWESYHDHHHSWSILWIDCVQVCSQYLGKEAGEGLLAGLSYSGQVRIFLSLFLAFDVLLLII